MKRYRYTLHIPEDNKPESSYVYADNKSEARAAIAKHYREEAPGGYKNGFVPFHKCRIEWTGEEVLPVGHDTSNGGGYLS